MRFYALVLVGLAVGGAWAVAPAAAALKKTMPDSPASKGTEKAAAPAADASKSPAEGARDAQGMSLLVLPITAEGEKLSVGIREALNFKAKRLGATVYDPASVAEVMGLETCSLATPTEQLALLGRKKFEADIIVVGTVTGNSTSCQVHLKAVYTADLKNPLVIEKTYSCPEPQYRGIRMAEAVYDIFRMLQPDDPLRALRQDPEIARRWKDGPNLVRNPGFEVASAAGTGPADWDPTGKLGTGGTVTWLANPDGQGKVIRYEMDAEVAGGYGMAYYSDWIPLEPGATYRFSCRYKSMAPTVKVFLKGYHEFPPQEGFPAQRRETYRRQVHPAGKKKEWNAVEADFIPVSLKPTQMPTWLKVDLFAYWPEGIVFWDDIVLKKVRDAPLGGPAKAEK